MEAGCRVVCEITHRVLLAIAMVIGDIAYVREGWNLKPK